MSINLENPKTVLEKIDAAANYVAQIRLAYMTQDDHRIETAIDKAAQLLFDVMRQIEEEELK